MGKRERIRYDLATVGSHGLFLHMLANAHIIDYYAYHKKMEKFCQQLTEEELRKYLCQWFWAAVNKKLDLENPVTFTQKIQWRKVYGITSLMTQCSDKYLVRNYVKEKMGTDEILIPLLGVWDKVEDIQIENLPNQFVLKANHGSGMNIIVRDKKNCNWKKQKERIRRWMETAMEYTDGFEMQYQEIPRRIIAEQYIEQADQTLLDYKFHCFDGKIYGIQVIGDRDPIHHSARQQFMDKDWNRISFSTEDYPLYGEKLPRPTNLGELVKTAECLSTDFDYVRVDLYSIDEKVMFGELTFTPGGGVYPNMAECDDREWGNYWKLPNVHK